MSNIAVLLTTYNRYDDFINILKKIKSKDHNIDVFAYNDCSSQEYVIPELKNCNLKYYRSNVNNGKGKYYKVINFLLDSLKKECLKSKSYKIVIMMQDDLQIEEDFIDQCINHWNLISKEVKSPIVTYHSDVLRKYHKCWNSENPVNGKLYDITGWVDCLFFTSIANFTKINFKLSGKYAQKDGKKSSSGVGKEFTRMFRESNVKLLRLNNSLAIHNGIESKMNSRPYNIYTFNYIKKTNKKIITSISSMSSRFENLKNTIDSLINQSDIINVYLNNYSNNQVNILKTKYNNVNFYPSQEVYGDLGDTGKFLFQNNSDYYLTCDDDIIYPKDYTKNMIEKINKHKCIVGFHGSLISSDEDYYKRKIKFHFNKYQKNDIMVNILGTGVMGFDNSEYLFPFDIIKTKNMSDIYIAKYGNNNNFNFMCLAKESGWIIPQEVEESIYNSSTKRDKTTLDNSDIINSIIKETNWRNLK